MVDPIGSSVSDSPSHERRRLPHRVSVRSARRRGMFRAIWLPRRRRFSTEKSVCHRPSAIGGSKRLKILHLAVGPHNVASASGESGELIQSAHFAIPLAITLALLA